MDTDINDKDIRFPNNPKRQKEYSTRRAKFLKKYFYDKTLEKEKYMSEYRIFLKRKLALQKILAKHKALLDEATLAPSSETNHPGGMWQDNEKLKEDLKKGNINILSIDNFENISKFSDISVAEKNKKDEIRTKNDKPSAKNDDIALKNFIEESNKLASTLDRGIIFTKEDGKTNKIIRPNEEIKGAYTAPDEEYIKNEMAKEEQRIETQLLDLLEAEIDPNNENPNAYSKIRKKQDEFFLDRKNEIKKLYQQGFQATIRTEINKVKKLQDDINEYNKNIVTKPVKKNIKNKQKKLNVKQNIKTIKETTKKYIKSKGEQRSQKPQNQQKTTSKKEELSKLLGKKKELINPTSKSSKSLDDFNFIQAESYHYIIEDSGVFEIDISLENAVQMINDHLKTGYENMDIPKHLLGSIKNKNGETIEAKKWQELYKIDKFTIKNNEFTGNSLKKEHDNKALALKGISLKQSTNEQFIIKRNNKEIATINKTSNTQVKVVFKKYGEKGKIDEKNVSFLLNAFDKLPSEQTIRVANCVEKPETAMQLYLSCILHGKKATLKNDGTLQTVLNSKYKQLYERIQNLTSKQMTPKRMQEIERVYKNIVNEDKSDMLELKDVNKLAQTQIQALAQDKIQPQIKLKTKNQVDEKKVESFEDIPPAPNRIKKEMNSGVEKTQNEKIKDNKTKNNKQENKIDKKLKPI